MTNRLKCKRSGCPSLVRHNDEQLESFCCSSCLALFNRKKKVLSLRSKARRDGKDTSRFTEELEYLGVINAVLNDWRGFLSGSAE